MFVFVDITVIFETKKNRTKLIVLFFHKEGGIKDEVVVYPLGLIIL